MADVRGRGAWRPAADGPSTPGRRGAARGGSGRPGHRDVLPRALRPAAANPLAVFALDAIGAGLGAILATFVPIIWGFGALFAVTVILFVLTAAADALFHRGLPHASPPGKHGPTDRSPSIDGRLASRGRSGPGLGPFDGAVGRQVGSGLDAARRASGPPGGRRCVGVAQAEVDPPVARGDVAAAAVDGADERERADPRGQPGADGVAVGSPAPQLDHQPVPAAPGLVPEDDARGDGGGRRPGRGRRRRRGRRRPGRGPRGGPEIAAGRGVDIREPPAAAIAAEDRRVRVGSRPARLGADVAVGGDEVEPAVMVEVGEGGAPAGQVPGVDREAGPAVSSW